VYVGRNRCVRLVLGSVVLTQYGKESAEERKSREGWTTTRIRGLGLSFARGGRLVLGSREERGGEGLTTSSRLWGGSLVRNGSTQRVKLVLRWTTAGVIRGTETRVSRQGIRASEYSLRMGFASLGLMVLVSSNDRVTLYLCLEWQALVLYVLAAFQRYSARSTEAGLKYFIQGSVMSGIYLLGATRIYGVWGTVNFTERRRRLGTEDGLMGGELGVFGGIPGSEGLRWVTGDWVGRRVTRLGLVRVRSTLRFKLAAVPFHAWAADVYEGSPTSSSTYFAVVPKIAVLSLRVRVLTCFVETQVVWQSLLRGVSVASMTLAPFSARAQMKWKRFLAYSSIANVGNILLALAMGGYAGLQAVWIYAVVYARTVLRVWLALGSVVKTEVEGGVRVHRPVHYIHELDGLSQNNPVLAYTIGVGILASAGLPPFAMFYAKRSVLFAAILNANRWMPIYLVRVSVLTTFYYLRFVKIRFFKTEASSKTVSQSLNRATSMIVGRARARMIRFLVDTNLLAGTTAWMAIASGV